MAVLVTFNGQSFSIPEDGEVGWSALTDYLVALAAAAVTTSMSFSARIATTTPQNLQATDAILAMNVGAASSAVLPSGVKNQFYGVFDVSGAADANPITVSTTGGQTIAGATSYVVRQKYGGVFLQFDGTEWIVISEVGDVFRYGAKVLNNAANASFVEGGIVATGAFAASADGTSASATFAGSNAIEFLVALSTGEAIRCSTSFASGAVSCVSDLSGLFLLSDAGVGLYVSKSAASGVVSVKNRMGGSRNIEIKALSTGLSGVSAWA